MKFNSIVFWVIIILNNEIFCEIAFSDLSKIGVIQARNYKLKIKGKPTYQYMVLNLVPNVSELSKCNTNAITEYKSMLNRIISPINQSLSLMKSYITPRTTGVKFWGAVVGGVALGVATSAQITAGIALHNSIQNAQAIRQLKDSIVNTNKAILSLQLATKQTVVAVSALQDQINTKIVPMLNQLGCDVITNTLKLQLNQYFSEISLIFGPNLRDPSSETISIQVLSQAFNNDFESLMKTLNYNSDDLLDVLQSDSIRGRIIDVDVGNYLITIQIEYPDMIEITNAVIQDFNKITFNYQGEEWITLFPQSLLIRSNLISNIDLTSCVRTDISYICLYDTSSPLSDELYDCATGITSKCAKTRIVNSYAPRFSLSGGVVFANCAVIPCVCKTNGQYIIQDKISSNTMISKDFCQEAEIDGIFIQVGDKRLNRPVFSTNITIGGQVVVDKIDIGNQISGITESIQKSEEFLKKSNQILSRINPNIINNSTLIYLIVISVIILIWLILLTAAVIYKVYKEQKKNQPMSYLDQGGTVNSLSQLIPVP